ncbi:MAG: hypothetical protein AAFX85_17920, partial [Pseudomonadota bacterium]
MNELLPPLQRHALRFPRRPLWLAGLVVVCAILTLSLQGCAYRITIQQGNFLDEELIDQVEMSMTRQQVQF